MYFKGVRQKPHPVLLLFGQFGRGPFRLVQLGKDLFNFPGEQLLEIFCRVWSAEVHVLEERLPLLEDFVRQGHGKSALVEDVQKPEQIVGFIELDRRLAQMDDQVHDRVDEDAQTEHARQYSDESRLTAQEFKKPNKDQEHLNRKQGQPHGNVSVLDPGALKTRGAIERNYPAVKG